MEPVPTTNPNEYNEDLIQKEQQPQGESRLSQRLRTLSKSVILEPMAIRYRSFMMLAVMTITATMGSAYFGFNLSVFGTLINPWFEEVYGIASDSSQNTLMVSLFNAVAGVGNVVGAAIVGILLGSLGRRRAFIITDILAIISQLLFQIPIIEVAFLARFLTSIFVGFNSGAVIVYLNEMIPAERAGLFISWNQVMNNLSILIAFGFSYGEVPTMGAYWRYVLAFPVLFCIWRIFSLTFLYPNDTPSYDYLLKDDRDKGMDTVKTIYKPEYVGQRMQELDKEKAAMGNGVSLKELWRNPAQRKRIIYGMILMLFQQLIGVNAIFLYASQVFQTAATNSKGVENHSLDSTYTILFSLLNFIFALFIGYIIDLVGRKKPMLLGILLNFVSLTCIGFAFILGYNDAIPLFFYIYILGFNLGMGCVAWVILGELIPNEGMVLCVMSNWLGNLVITSTFDYLEELLGEGGAFLFFAFFAFWNFLFVLFFIIETRGKTEVDVAIAYGEKVDSKKHSHSKVDPQ